MKHQGLSIRYKILLLLTCVPLVTLAAYLVLAIQVFQKDKIAYVFDSTLSVSRTLSSQVQTELSGVLFSAKPAMQEFLNSRTFGKVSQAILDSDGKIDWIAAYQRANDRFESSGMVEKLQGAGQRDLQSLGDLTSFFEEVSTKGRSVRVPFKDNRILIAERVGQARDQDEKIFIVFGKAPDLANGFQSASGEVFLINEQAQVLFGPAGIEISDLTERIPRSFIGEILAKDIGSGTKELADSKKKAFLVSYSKTNFSDLTVVSMVNRAEALRAVDILIRRSVAFFILLISVSSIISLLASGSLTAALTDLAKATRKVSEGQFDFKVKVKSKDEVGGLADSFNAMASEVSRLMGETAEKARMESELKTAHTVQETLFPPTEANLNGLKIAGYYEPASECGGDWWHYCKVENKIFLWIGDATGHGAPAALITSAAKSAATIIEHLNVEPGQALELLNRAIYDVSKGRIMMTFFLGCFDLETRQLTYANASHETPYLMKVGEQPLSKAGLIPLNDVRSPRLGEARRTQYEQSTITLERGDRILFYTDGLPDIENLEKAPWGEREFIKSVISSNKTYPPIEDSVRILVRQFSTYRQKAPLKDDITFFMVQLEGETAEFF